MMCILKAKWDNQQQECKILDFVKNCKNEFVIHVELNDNNITGYILNELEYIKF